MKLRMPTGSELQYNSISVHSTRCVCAKTTISLQPEPDVPYSAKPTEVPTQTTPLPANCKPQHQAITNHQNPGSVCPPCQMHDEQQPAIACRETLCCPGLDRSMWHNVVLTVAAANIILILLAWGSSSGLLKRCEPRQHTQCADTSVQS